MTELLVVMAAIALISAVIIPAVQSVRESARSTSCTNNLRQLALATLNYESSNRKLPIGEGGIDNNWMTELLPYLERKELYKNIKNVDPNSVRTVLDIPEGQSIIPPFACPSDPDGLRLKRVGDREGELAARTCYVGCSGTSSIEGNGVFLFRKAVTLAEIGDGLSNTLLIGERPAPKLGYYGTWLFSGPDSYSATGHTTLGVTETADLVGMGQAACGQSFRLFSKGNTEDNCHALHYWSYHPEGGHFCFVDGSVRLFSYDSDFRLRALATRNGGEKVDVRHE